MKTQISRRSFLAMLLMACGATVGGFSIRKKKDFLYALLKSEYSQLKDPGMISGPTEKLSQKAVEALTASVEAIVGNPVEIRHYENYFLWHSEHVPGYRDLYEQFAEMLDRESDRAVGKPFLANSISIRQEILKNTCLSEASTGDLSDALFKRNCVRYQKYIINEVMALFSHTDAWILLGYKNWPGSPRGLVDYRKAPPTISNSSS